MEYIAKNMAPYDEELEVDPYIHKTHEELKNEYQKFKMSPQYREEYNTLENYCIDYCGYQIDDSGNVISTSNTDSLWDWYCIGGRWDGQLFENSPTGDEIMDNSIKVSTFLDKYNANKDQYTYHTVIDKDDMIHSDRKMGWFASYDKIIDDDTWTTEFETLLNNAKNDYLVGIDCHI